MAKIWFRRVTSPPGVSMDPGEIQIYKDPENKVILYIGDNGGNTTVVSNSKRAQALTLMDPIAGDQLTILKVPYTTYVSEIWAQTLGAGAIDFDIYAGTDPVTSSELLTSVSSFNDTAGIQLSLTDQVLAEDRWIWMRIFNANAIDQLHITIMYHEIP